MSIRFCYMQVRYFVPVEYLVDCMSNQLPGIAPAGVLRMGNNCTYFRKIIHFHSLTGNCNQHPFFKNTIVIAQ